MTMPPHSDKRDVKECDHPTLKVVVRNMPLYHCDECGGTFFVFASYLMMESWVPQMGVFSLEWFAKKNGMEALQEALTKAIPQYTADGSQQRIPALAGIQALLAAQQEQEAIAEGTPNDRDQQEPEPGAG